MPLARLYDRHAEDCARAAEQTDDPRDRAMLIKLADGWRKAAQELRLQHPSPSQEQPLARNCRLNTRPHTARSQEGVGDHTRSVGNPGLRVRIRFIDG